MFFLGSWNGGKKLVLSCLVLSCLVEGEGEGGGKRVAWCPRYKRGVGGKWETAEIGLFGERMKVGRERRSAAGGKRKKETEFRVVGTIPNGVPA